MTAALTPALALDYLSELSADIRAAIVLDAGGMPLALRRAEVARGSDAALAAAAREFVAEAPAVRALTKRGGAFGARDNRHAVVVVTGPLALPQLAIHDIRSVLSALGGMPLDTVVSDASAAAARALLEAL
jgi:hypothetical protein